MGKCSRRHSPPPRESSGVPVPQVSLSGTKCGNGMIDVQEECDDGNSADRDCCSARCRFDPADTLCTSGGNVCIGICDGAGTCAPIPNTSPCNDNQPCTTGDVCTGGVCTGTPSRRTAHARATGTTVRGMCATRSEHVPTPRFPRASRAHPTTTSAPTMSAMQRGPAPIAPTPTRAMTTVDARSATSVTTARVAARPLRPGRHAQAMGTHVPTTCATERAPACTGQTPTPVTTATRVRPGTSAPREHARPTALRRPVRDRPISPAPGS